MLDMLQVEVKEEERDTKERELNDLAIEFLAYCGEPVYHLAKSATLLALALQIFGVLPSSSSTTSPSPPTTSFGHSYTLLSIHIWRLRSTLIWLRVLDEPVPLPTYITVSAHDLRHQLSSSSPDLAPLTLSLSILVSLLSRSSPHSSAMKEASTLARDAAKEGGLEWCLTGRMGKRTKWQESEKTQLVVLARDGSVTKVGEEKKLPEVFKLNDDTLLEQTSFSSTTISTPTIEEENENEDPSIISASTTSELFPLTSLDPSAQPTLTSFSQSLLLSLSISTLPPISSLLNLHLDVLSTSQVSAFVARVLSTPSNWSVTTMALLLRSRAEAGRTRTVERGVLQMQALVDQMRDGSPTMTSAISSGVKPEDWVQARERLEQFHGLSLPPSWEMEKELATRYLSLGISKSALEIFERLEMWEEVAKCWVSLERPEKGVDVVKELLGLKEGGKVESGVVMDGRKIGGGHYGGAGREAKLWCILGELEKDPKHYEKAWEISNHRSSRAQRSLGAVYFSAGDWEKAKIAFRIALKINPLFGRTWFVLGCCEMRLDEWAGAQESFGRCVALDDEDAESWSNLASCHLRRGEVEGDKDDNRDDEEEEEEGGVDSTGVANVGRDERVAERKLPFSRKRAAFHCLKQAIKHSYDSWRMWTNYMVIAVDVGELSEACRALGRIVEMRGDRDGESSVDLEVLERLVDAATKDHADDDNGEGQKPHVDPNVGKGLLPRVTQLINSTILPRVSSSPRVFKAQARLLLSLSDFQGALAAQLSAYRCGIAADTKVEYDLPAFNEAVMGVEDTVGMLENLGPKAGLSESEWKFQARSIVRAFLGRTKEAFEDEGGYDRLKESVKELK